MAEHKKIHDISTAEDDQIDKALLDRAKRLLRRGRNLEKRLAKRKGTDV